MPTATALPLRNDTILGVCQGLSEDFGIHANWLRVAFAGTFYFNPFLVLGIYFALGLAVAVSRRIAPDELVAAAAPPASPPMLLEAGLAEDADELQLAA
ncbi:MAG: PspC domain-containing protein [Pseudomonadota bacterium]|nr:PspC domain-containing protein [Pseudomonadota bacterium]